jgi:hypothetical protein
VAREIGDHSKYPGALVAPDGEIYFRRASPPDEVPPEAPAEESPSHPQDKPNDRKDAQQ